MAYDYDKLKKMELYQVGGGTEPYAIADRKAREGLVEAQEDIDEILEDIAYLQEEDVKLKEDLAQQERSLDLLWKLNKGIAYTLEEDEEVKSNKVIPSGAMAFNLDVVGGMSIKGRNLLDTVGINTTRRGLNIVTRSDGMTIDISGTPSNTYIAIPLNSVFLPKVGNLTASLTLSNTGGIRQIRLSNNDISKYLFNFTNIRIGEVNKSTISVNESIEYNCILLTTDATTELNCSLKFMIEEGTTAHDFEPYTDKIINSDCNKVIVSDGTNTKEYTIPQAIRNLDGYGWGINEGCYNYIDFNTMKYHKKVGRVDLGTLRYYYDTNKYRFYTNSIRDMAPHEVTTPSNIMCGLYETVVNTAYITIDYRKIMGSDSNTPPYLWIRNRDYSDINEFKTAMNGVYFYYELAEEVVTDISDLIPSELLEAILCEANGTIKFNMSDSTYAIDIPNKEEYIIKVSEATS